MKRSIPVTSSASSLSRKLALILSLGTLCLPALGNPSAPFPIQPLPQKADAFLPETWKPVPRLTCAAPKPGDFSGTAQMQYDAEALYLRFDIRDDRQQFAPGAPFSLLYQFDSTEFWIDRHQYIVGLVDGKAIAFDYFKNRVIEGTQSVVRTSEEGYELVIRIPWTQLDQSPAPRKLFQCSFRFNDVDSADGQHTGRKYTLPADAHWDDPITYGAVFFNDSIKVENCASVLEPLFSPKMETGGYVPRNRLILAPNPSYAPLQVQYVLNDDAGKPRGEGVVQLRDETVMRELPLADKAAINRIDFTAKFDNGGPFGPVGMEFFANSKASLRDYRSDIKPPEDFNAFWDNAIKELAAEPMAPETERLAASNDTADLWQVTLRGWRGVRFVAYLSIPKAEGKFPLNLSVYPAMPQFPEKVPLSDSQIHLRVSPRGFGASECFSPKPAQLYVADCDKPQDFYLLGNILDIVRAIDFALTQKKADPSRIFVSGGSRGGYLTMALAAADRRISVASATVPCYADVDLMGRVGHSSAAMDAYLAVNGGTAERREKMRRIWAYFDAVNLATRIQCPIIVQAGMLDTICAAPGIIDAFNHIPSKEKYLIINPEHGHCGTEPGGVIRNFLQVREGIPSQE